ncbi:MAG: hypothetical protein IJD57_00440 [Candidatus Gastranaerophilales bacterium]|nr:hypothetical protein [Candidatus Gastranaerophilales bacterium]
MGWVTLTLRKESLRQSIHDGQSDDTRMSRTIRANSRQLSLDQTLKQNELQRLIKDAKEDTGYLALEEERKSMSVSDPGYEQWSEEFKQAQEDFQEAKVNLQDEYDIILQNLEEEATDREQRMSDQQVILEANLQAWNAELEAVNEAISSEIEAQKIKLG